MMNQSTSSSSASPDLLMCILSYFGILALIPYFVRKDDAFIQWHARQGVLLAATMIGLSIVLAVLSMLPVVGFFASLASMLVGLGSLVLSIYCMVQAYSGRRWEIPMLGTLVK